MKKLLFTTFFLFLLNAGFSQTKINGTVSAAKETLIGVSIYFPSSYEGATSDLEGAFSFETSLEGEQWLHYQYIGYKQDSVLVDLTSEELNLDIKMEYAVNELAQVIVSAGVFEASDTRKTAVLSPIDIVTTGASGDLADALSILPGTNTEGETGQLIVRGGAASETQAVLNGLRIPKFYQGAVQDVPARSRFNPFDFKGISFATGGFSAEFGEALSAVLSLNTPGVPEQSRTSIGLMSVGASLGHTQKMDSQAISLSANYTNVSPYLILAGKDDDFEKNPENVGIQLGYWNEFNDGSLLKVYSQSSSNKMVNVESKNAAFYGSSKLGLNNINSFNQAVYQQPLKNNALLQTAVAYAYDKQEFLLDQGIKVNNQNDVQLRSKLSGEWNQKIIWQAGAEYSFRDESIALDFEPEIFAQSNVKNYSALFGESQTILGTKWLVRTGLRIDNYEKWNVHFAPRLSVNYLLNKNEQLGFSVGRFNQKGNGIFAEKINTDPTKSDHVIATYQGKWEGRVLRAELYYKNYHNLELNEGSEITNNGEGYSQGIDLFFRERKLIKNGDVWLSLSYNDNQRKWDQVEELSNTPFSPKYSVAVVYKHFFPKPSLGISLTYRYHSGRPYQNPNEEGWYQNTSPQYHDLSANLSYLTNFKGHFMVIFASLNNVPGLNQVHTYRYAQIADMEGHYPRTEVDNLLPRFPFVGAFININETKENISKDDL